VTSEWRALLAGSVVALVAMAGALLATNAAGLPLRDPDHVAGGRLVLVLGLVAALVGLDVIVRAARGARTRWPSRAAMLGVWRERWTLRRGISVASALVSFYVSYLAYRNLKSVVPVLRPDELFDRQLADLDRVLLGGNDPAVLLHSVMGTDISAQIMSSAYMLFFAFIPGTLAFALVFSPDLRAGLFYAIAQSINWLLGAASYFALPALGPVYAEPTVFANLPPSGASRLQEILLHQRVEFLHDPVAGTAQSIAAFSSLHVSVYFTAALAAHLLGLRWRVRIGAWILLGLTMLATIYLGWHYVVDDLGGLVIGAVAIVLARALTGFDVRPARTLFTPSPRPL
jgi:membrane-associated phospholipid phosphatase